MSSKKPEFRVPKWVLLISAIAVATLVGTASLRWWRPLPQEQTPRSRLGHYQFTLVHENPSLPIVVQQGGSCWCYSATSLFESEIIRLTGQRVKLSEAYSMRQAYYDKARHYLLRQGNSFFDEGADSHDVLLAIGRYGMMPASQYPGFVSKNPKTNPHQMTIELQERIKPSVSLSAKHPKVWQAEFDLILDRYLGSAPMEFEYNGHSYSRVEFRDAFHIDAKDYVLISSFTHAPYYQPFVLEMLGNYANFQAYNLPLDEWEENLWNGLESGYTASFDCDVSEPFFLGNEGVAILPARTIGPEEVLEGYVQEREVTQETRQEEFEASQTVDDHQMHAIGVAMDAKGTRYFKLKNSWGTESGREGYVYMSSTYARAKVLSALLHRGGLKPETRKRLGLERGDASD
jgi:bleomycin hydrolase